MKTRIWKITSLTFIAISVVLLFIVYIQNNKLDDREYSISSLHTDLEKRDTQIRNLTNKALLEATNRLKCERSISELEKQLSECDAR